MRSPREEGVDDVGRIFTLFLEAKGPRNRDINTLTW
jgi:hypothetical protein